MDASDKAFNGNASDNLANEWTFLAWIRTSIGMIGFGFVVGKFSLFVHQIGSALGNPPSGTAVRLFPYHWNNLGRFWRTYDWIFVLEV